MSTDPARAAALRQLEQQMGHPWVSDHGYTVRVRTEAAREALAPIRARHHPVMDYVDASERKVKLCAHCRRPWPCADAFDAYSEDELREEPAQDRLRGHPVIPVPPTVPEQTAARFAGPTITPEENP